MVIFKQWRRLLKDRVESLSSRDDQERKGLCATLKEAEDAICSFLALACDPVVLSADEGQVLVCYSELRDAADLHDGADSSLFLASSA